jgi:5'-nucleotidase
MKLLLTNDDGFDAPGLAALHKIAVQLGEPVVVAPVDHLSGCSHRVTTDRPIRVCRHDERRFAVEGTPADCVRVGLHAIAPEVECVLSGINAGGNLGSDVYHSGTVAAVREAALHGRTGIAISHYRKRGRTIDWELATTWLASLLRDLLSHRFLSRSFWNINLPHVESGAPAPEVVFCPLDYRPLPLNFRQDGDCWHYDGDYHARERMPGRDVENCLGGKITVTRLSLDHEL